MSPLRLAAAAAALATVGLLWQASRGDGPENTALNPELTVEAAAPEDERPEVDLLPVGERTEREEVAPAPPEPEKPSLANTTLFTEEAPFDRDKFPGLVRVEPGDFEELPVFGRVLDAAHRPQPGVIVRLIQPLRAARHSATTDEYGEFDLGVVAVYEASALAFGERLFGGQQLRQQIERHGGEQLLRLPAPPSTVLELELVAAGESTATPVPTWARLDLQKGGAKSSWRRSPTQDQVTLMPGRILVEGLDYGQWQVWLQCRGSQPQRHVVGLTERGPNRVRVEVTLGEELEGDYDEHRLSAADEDPSRDPSRGFADFAIKGQKPRGWGEGGNDRFFGHTFANFGVGPVRRAYLELDLETAGGMAYNDGMHLEYNGPEGQPRFLWGTRVADLPGAGGWRHHRRQRFLLDLSALPRKDGDPVDLRGHLEDGLLDILVGDDTLVHDVALRVLR